MSVVVIVGAGPAGLVAAEYLSRYSDQFKILLIDKNDKIGRKILATGNGKCNISNTQISKENYHGEIDACFDFVLKFDARQYFFDLGILLKQKGVLLYPYSQQAKTIRQCFENHLLERGVTFMLNREIIDFKKKKSKYILIDKNNQQISCDYLILSTGGKAAIQYGSDGLMLEVLKQKQIQVSPLYPSLVQLETKPNFKSCKGGRIQGRFSLFEYQQCIASYKGEALMCDYGLSGISILQLSGYLSHKKNAHPYIEIDFCEDLSDSLLETYYNRFKDSENIYEGILGKELGHFLAKQKCTSFEHFLETLHHFKVEVIGTLDFKNAQVTKGGIYLDELDQFLMLKKFPNVFAAGEILNVDGDCGGYNLHFVMSSAIAVSKRIVELENIR